MATRPDETAHDLFKRLRKEASLEIPLQGRTERFESGDLVEINISTSSQFAPFISQLCNQLKDNHSEMKILLAAMTKVCCTYKKYFNFLPIA